MHAGAQFIVIPRDANILIVATADMLPAAKSADIRTYGNRFFTLDFGLNHKLRWVFIAAALPYPINSMDLLKHSALLVIAGHTKLVDREASLNLTGSRAVVNKITP